MGRGRLSRSFLLRGREKGREGDSMLDGEEVDGVRRFWEVDGSWDRELCADVEQVIAIVGDYVSLLAYLVTSVPLTMKIVHSRSSYP